MTEQAIKDAATAQLRPDEANPTEPVNGFYGPGMSLRDWFAGMAMQGLLAAQVQGFNVHAAKERFASMSYEMADAMLAQRE